MFGFYMFPLPGGLQTPIIVARVSGLTHIGMEIEKFCSLALRRTPEVKWYQYLGTEGVLDSDPSSIYTRSE